MHLVWARVTLGEQMDTHPREKQEGRRRGDRIRKL
jgi:hypothetical protein